MYQGFEGAQGHCTRCDTTLQIDKTDGGNIRWDQSDNGTFWVADCINCGNPEIFSHMKRAELGMVILAKAFSRDGE